MDGQIDITVPSVSSAQLIKNQICLWRIQNLEELPFTLKITRNQVRISNKKIKS
jgi:hypothetical protein